MRRKVCPARCGPTVTRDNPDPDPAVGDTSVADPHGQFLTQCDGSSIAIGGKRIEGAKGRFRFLLGDVDLNNDWRPVRRAPGDVRHQRQT